MNKNTFTSIFMIIMTVALAAIHLMASTQDGILQQLSENEKKAVEAIALYPKKIRENILQTASYPEVLARMQNIREKTEEKFKALLENLPTDDQKILFNLSRYPDLIEKIIQQKNSNENLNQIISDYPKEIQEQAVFANKNYYQLLSSINELYIESKLAFENILKNYPEPTKHAYQELIKLPEIITILSENMNTTVLLGDLYQKKPTQLFAALDSLNIVIAEEKTKELNEWKQNLEENPEAMAEYEQAAKEFTKEQGVDESKYTTYIPDEKKTEIEIRYEYKPYPYWFGWPWWYNYECWYPYPYWYHLGYYYGSANVIVFVGLPSNYYMNWHFHHHDHFYHYPNFTNQVVNYYYGHRKSRNSITSVVGNWEKNVSTEVPNNFLNNDKNRPNRIKEYGKFKMDYQSSVRNANNRVPDQMNYLKNNAYKYPSLRPILNEKPTTILRPIEKEKNIPIRENNVQKYEPRQKIINEKRSSYQEIQRANNYHHNSLEKPVPRYQTIPRPSSPRQATPRQATPKQIVPRQQAPKQNLPQQITPQRKKNR